SFVSWQPGAWRARKLSGHRQRRGTGRWSQIKPARRRSDLAGFECIGPVRFAHDALSWDGESSDNIVRYSVSEGDRDSLVAWVVRYEAIAVSILEYAICRSVSNDGCVHLSQQRVGIRPVLGHGIGPIKLKCMWPRDAFQRWGKSRSVNILAACWHSCLQGCHE